MTREPHGGRRGRAPAAADALAPGAAARAAAGRGRLGRRLVAALLEARGGQRVAVGLAAGARRGGEGDGVADTQPAGALVLERRAAPARLCRGGGARPQPAAQQLRFATGLAADAAGRAHRAGRAALPRARAGGARGAQPAPAGQRAGAAAGRAGGGGLLAAPEDRRAQGAAASRHADGFGVQRAGGTTGSLFFAHPGLGCHKSRH